MGLPGFVCTPFTVRGSVHIRMTSSTSPPTPRARPSKRLCVLSDGTWNTPENPEPSNIVKLAENIRMTDDDGVSQIVFYDKGVGTSGSDVERFMGGAFGQGIDENIKQLYTFLSHNYEEGDEVYMFGFSRGAYTIRSLAGLIHDCGLVRRNGLDRIEDAYSLYRKNLDINSPELVEFRNENGSRIPLELLMCFETVGSLGVPKGMGVLNRMSKGKYQFHDTKLSDIIRNAIHCLALDEERLGFTPTLMYENEAVNNQLTQKFFWGTHGGIGGSEGTELEVGAATLRFTVGEMARRGLGLSFHNEIIPEFPDMTVDKKIVAGKLGFNKTVDAIVGKYIRKVKSADDIHFTAVERFQKNPKWRPASLEPIHEQVLAVDLAEKVTTV